MGSNKGQSQSQQQQYQSQTYTPNAQAMGYIQNAMGRAANTANLPFNIPQAPVAGFSPDQYGAFQQFRNAQGAAQPYYAQAANYFSPQGTQDFYNPYAANVMANMKDMYGQQMTQNDASLTQAAGGVGADRIGVGHAALAKQQDLAAGQTMADLWQRAGAQAQSAGQGQMALGQNVQNSQLQGSNALLGVGGLQQQLSQAQMNSPYQQQLAMAAFPYQQAQFLAGITGSLAPGMGGTTAGWGNTNSQSTPAQPSIWSQLLGAGMAGVGAYNAFGGGNGGMNPFGSYDSYGGGNAWNSAYGGSASNPLPGLTASDYGARGGRMNAHAAGGSVEGYDNGGACNCPPSGSAPGSDIGPYQSPPLLPGPPPAPPSATPPATGDAASNMPQAAPQFAPQAASPVPPASAWPQLGGGSGGSNWNNPWTTGSFGASGPKGNTGGGGVFGRSGYAEGGDVDTGMPSGRPIDVSHASIIPQTQLAPIQAHIPQLNFSQPQQQSGSGGGGSGIGMGDIAKVAMMFANSGGRVNPYATGGVPHYGDEGDPGGAVYRMPDQPNGVNPYDTWRDTTPTVGDGGPALALSADPPGAAGVRAIGKAASGMPAVDTTALAEAGGEEAAPLGGQGMSPPSPAPAGRERGFADSPWAALMAAGLGMMGGTSPYAGVNIGSGGMQGMKMLQQQRENALKDETADQAVRRLQQEAKFHEDQYTRETLAQKNARTRLEETAAYERATPVKLGQDKNGYDIMGIRDPKNPGKYLDVDGSPLDMSRFGNQQPKAVPGTTGVPEAKADGVLNANAAMVADGPYDYAQDAPYIEKGMELPEPQAVGGKSSRSVQTDAEYYLTTGKLPPVKAGKSPVAIAQQNYRNSVQNYGNALASSRGMTPEQVAEGWRTAPGMMRFILGADGRATVALGTATRHLDTLEQYIDAAKYPDSPRFRQLQAMVSREWGATAATNIDALSAIVGPEIVKAIGVAGAGTEHDRSQFTEMFRRGTTQAKEAITGIKHLMEGQLEGKERQAAQAGVSSERFKKLIGEDEYSRLKTLGGSGAQRTPEDKAALDWANANPKDERAAAIKKRLGVQ